ncbi:MAG: hypothetical protein AB1778_05525 [Candidatus Bipolaricaulota bacterium]
MRSTICVIVCLLLAYAACPAWAVSSESRGINTVLLFGGPKDLGLVEMDAGARVASARPTSRVALPIKMKTLTATKSTPYGNSYVRTYFSSDVEIGLTCAWAEITYGTTTTTWDGTAPQCKSSRIRLDELWAFNGWCVTVSIPSGGGFSSSAKTVSWTGEDVSGDHWAMRHIYSGIRASACLWLTSIRQSSNGSHYFETENDWVSANASRGISTF